MNFTKEQLLKIKKLYQTLDEKIPNNKKMSIAMTGGINSITIIYSIYSLIMTDLDTEIIIKSLIASGITTGILITLILHYIESYNEEKVKVRKNK